MSSKYWRSDTLLEKLDNIHEFVVQVGSQLDRTSSCSPCECVRRLEIVEDMVQECVRILQGLKAKLERAGSDERKKRSVHAEAQTSMGDDDGEEISKRNDSEKL